MRRLARPTGLSRELARQQRRQLPGPGLWRTRKRRALLENPQAVTLEQGTGPTKKSFPVFELPDVVLDLDAEGNPHVRPYEEESDGPSQDSKWGWDPAIPEVEQQARSYLDDMTRDRQLLRHVSSKPFAPESITDHDVMTVALCGKSSVTDLPRHDSPRDAASCRSLELKSLVAALRSNGIPEFIISRDANTVIQFMLHRQQLQTATFEDPSLRAEGEPNDADAFKQSLDQCNQLGSLSRLYSRIDSPLSGFDVGADVIDDVHDGLLRLLRSQDERCTPEHILKFVNNVTIKRMSNNKELNRSMTLFGLQLSSSVGLLPCILQYLQICLSMGFIDEHSEAVSLTRLQVGRSMLAAMERGDAASIGIRQQIFTLLTGRSSEPFLRQPSLFGLAAVNREQRPEVLDLRVTLLGELGALRLLWYQWKQGQQARTFVRAFRRCAQVLSSAKGGGMGVDTTTATGHVEKDAALDSQTINALGAFHAARGSKVPSASVSGFNELTPKSPRTSDDEIEDAFAASNVLQAMRRFKILIDKIAAAETISEQRDEAEQDEITEQNEASTDDGAPAEGVGEDTGEGPRSYRR